MAKTSEAPEASEEEQAPDEAQALSDGTKITLEGSPADALLCAQLKALSETIDEAQAEADAAAERAKEKKAALQAAHLALHRYVKRVTGDKEALPLFDGNGQAGAGDADEGWREMPLHRLDIPQRTLNALASAEITTLGQLADYSADKPLGDLKGIGEAAAKRIDEATEDFWRQRNEAEANGEAK